MARQCGCLGGNENCTFCYGSGYIADKNDRPVTYETKDWGVISLAPFGALGTVQRSESKIDYARASTEKGKQAAQPRAFGCQYCSARFNSAAEVETHIDSEHVASVSDTSDQAKSKPLVRLGDRVFERRALRSAQERPKIKVQRARRPKVLRAGHPTALTKAPALASRVPARTSEGPPSVLKRWLVHCPKCTSPVREDRLKRHLHKHHGVPVEALEVAASTNYKSVSPTGAPGAIRRPIRKLPSTRTAGSTTQSDILARGKGYGGPEEEGDDQSATEIESYWEERRLDGSRDYWQIREDGRFGSHPTFDDCDDESAP